MQSNFDSSPDKNIGVSVHAGFPNAAEDHSGSALDFNQLLVHHPSSTYCFRIAGRAHEERGIFDGDIAVIDRSLEPRSTDLILYFADGESDFIITYYRTLRPRTDIWGVVTAVIHMTRGKKI